LKFIKIVGFILTVVGLCLSFPPVAKALTFNFGQVGDRGGLVVFAVGWALLFGHLIYTMGLERQKEK
jgi:hypothetical protein